MKTGQIHGLFTAIVLCLTIIPVVSAQETDSIYQAYQEADNVWRIVEDKTVNIYLIQGKDSALVIDTGYGRGDLKKLLQSITELPLIIVNTHGHGDHIGSDSQFPRIYMHPKDFELYHASMKRGAASDIPGPDLIPLREGHVFDLGGRKLEVMEVPGHTAGSICLVDKNDRMLFAGDHINAVVWLFLDTCLPLEVYMSSLEKIQKQLENFDTIMPGHNEPLDKTYLKELMTCVQSILDGTCQSEPYNYSRISEGARMCKYKRAQVAYDPDKLFVDK